MYLLQAQVSTVTNQKSTLIVRYTKNSNLPLPAQYNMDRIHRGLNWTLKPSFLPLLFSKQIFMGHFTAKHYSTGGDRSMNGIKPLPSISNEEK